MPQIALFPLGTVLVPGAELPLRIFEPRYVEMLHDLMADPSDVRQFGVVAIRAGHEVGTDQARSLHAVGCSAVLEYLAPVGEGQFALVARGSRRFRLDRLDAGAGTSYPTGVVSWLDEPVGDEEVADQLAARVRRGLDAYWSALGLAEASAADLSDDPTGLSYQVTGVMVLDVTDRQRLLAADDTVARLRIALSLVQRERVIVRELGAVPQPPELGGASLN